MTDQVFTRTRNPHEATIRKNNPMALPIVLRRDKNQEVTHEQLLLAAFSHMALISEKARNQDWTESWSVPYEAWRGGKFRKIVKRANPQRFDALAEDPEAIRTVIEIDGESIELLSLPPYQLSDPDPRVKPLQVSGLNYEPVGEFPEAENRSVKISREENSENEAHSAISLTSSIIDRPSVSLVLAYDSILGASTGKMMAQAAHGAQLLSQTVVDWKVHNKPIEVIDNFDAEDVQWILSVTDSGFTEIAPNSTTVKVGVRKVKKDD